MKRKSVEESAGSARKNMKMRLSSGEGAVLAQNAGGFSVSGFPLVVFALIVCISGNYTEAMKFFRWVMDELLKRNQSVILGGGGGEGDDAIGSVRGARLGSKPLRISFPLSDFRFAHLPDVDCCLLTYVCTHSYLLMSSKLQFQENPSPWITCRTSYLSASCPSCP